MAVLPFGMNCKRVPSPQATSPTCRAWLASGAREFSAPVGEACQPSGRLASSRPTPPTKFHRYNSIKVHSRVYIRSSKPLLFSRLQKSAHLVENKRPQTDCFQSLAHSSSLFSCKSCVCRSYAKHTRGCTPLPSKMEFRKQDFARSRHTSGTKETRGSKPQPRRKKMADRPVSRMQPPAIDNT